jgi:hypothetical protein
MELSSVAYTVYGDVGFFRELANYNSLDIFDMLPDDILIPPLATNNDLSSTQVTNWFL